MRQFQAVLEYWLRSLHFPANYDLPDSPFQRRISFFTSLLQAFLKPRHSLKSMSPATFKATGRTSAPNARQRHKSMAYQSTHVFRPYTTLHARIDRFLSELTTILPICSQAESERLWLSLQDIFRINECIYPISPQLPRFLTINRQKQNLRRIAVVISHLPDYHHPS